MCIYGEGNGTPLQYSCLENPMDGGAWWAALHGVAKSPTQLTSLSLFNFSIGEGNGNPLQCSCLGNPRGGGAWGAAIYGVAQSWTQLKQLSRSVYLLIPNPQYISTPHPLALPHIPFGIHKFVFLKDTCF